MDKKRFLKYIKGMLCPPSYIDKMEKNLAYQMKKLQLEQNILYDTKPGTSSTHYCENEIIVSLTTYGKRIYDVHLTIESIMEQTLKPNRIQLWIDNQYKMQQLPTPLELLKEKGLEICYCKDIGPYTKLIPALRENSQSTIITVDDDLLYEFDVLERLIKQHQATPEYILANRMHRITMGTNGKILPYNKWTWSYSGLDAHPNNFPTGVGGVLYPPNSLDQEVFNEKIFTSICKYADDIWFKAMALKKGTLSKRVYTHNKLGEDYLLNEEVQDIGLLNINTTNQNLNDSQFKAVFEKYNLYPLLQDK